MGKKALTAQHWDAVLAAFREQPGNVKFAAEQAQITRQSALKAWETGWRVKGALFGQKPIKEILQDEYEQARAERSKRQQDADRIEAEQRLQAKVDAIETRRDEGIIAKHARRITINAYENLLVLNNQCRALINEVSLRLKDPVKLAALSLDDIRKYIALVGWWLTRVEQAAEATLRIERIIAGDPNKIISEPIEAVTSESMAHELAMIGKTLARAEQLRVGKEPDWIEQELNDAVNTTHRAMKAQKRLETTQVAPIPALTNKAN